MIHDVTVSTAEMIWSRTKLDDKYMENWGGLVGSGGGLFTTSQLPPAKSHISHKHSHNGNPSTTNSMTVRYVQGKMRVWCVVLLSVCLVKADRDARWLLPGTDITAVVHERRTVTQTTMSSCVVVAPSLQPCDRPDIAPTASTK